LLFADPSEGALDTAFRNYLVVSYSIDHRMAGQSVSELFQNLLSETTIHAVPRLHRSNGKMPLIHCTCITNEHEIRVISFMTHINYHKSRDIVPDINKLTRQK
jgi:hypothetical protein